MPTQKEFIEKFRKDKYKIGSEKENIELLKEDLQNSISQLANDLYSDGIHFVLELIQNADDNEYITDKKPLLKFVIDEEKILVQNNEKGFTDENVISLCSVGKSKKTKQQGYIGEKGIGFKSVFRISDEPHIFSNGFQFKFKRIDEELGLGYIVPYWVEKTPDFIDKGLTNILLPLNKEAKKELSKFSEIEPELLLFLRRLFTVEIHNKIDNTLHKYTKTIQNGIVKIESKNREDNFKLVSQTLEVPESVKEEKREINKTDLVLGFPVNKDGTAKADSEQKVFAFLPTKGYGFKFMIQADFLVPASREDILKFKEWNIWLRDSISKVFLKSVETFKNNENLKSNFYKYIPLESDVTDSFFSTVVEKLKSELSESNCILTDSGKWLKPSQVFRASEEIRSLISPENLYEFFGKEYISIDVEKNTEAKILDFLGVASFSLNDLIELLKNTDWLKKQSDEWLRKLYIYLKAKLSKNGISTVKKLKIVRLKNGEMGSPIEKIFFPFEQHHSYGFEKQLPFIKRAVVKGNEDFLKDLGVLSAEPFDVIENYILKDFESNNENENWKSKSEEVRIGYINYIKDNLAEYENIKGNIDRLRDNIWITLKDNKFWIPKKIYLSKEYGDKYDLEFLLSGIENIHFVHPQYIELSKKEIINTELDQNKQKEKLNNAVEEWREFFIKLGVESKPRIESQISERSHWTSGNNHYKRTIEIFSSPIICSVIDEGNTKKNAQLLKILEADWSYYKNYIKWTDYSFYYDWNSLKRESDWYAKIARAKWLPAKNGSIEEPKKLFLDKPEIRKILDDNVLYLNTEIKNHEFISALGINSEVNVETVITVLRNLVISKSNNGEIFNKCYHFLNEKFKGKEHPIKKAFLEENLLFIPEISNEYVSGAKTVWKDVSQILGNYRYYLEKYYPKLKNFFVQKIGIPEKPIAKDYADILIQLSKKGFIEKDEKEKILKIYKELNKFLENEDSEERSITKETWWDDFIEQGIFWTNKTQFWRNDNDVFVNNDEDLYELFKDRDTIAFLKVPQTELPRLSHFIKKTRLKPITESIKSEIEKSVECEYEEELTNNINNLLIYIFRYIYHKESQIYRKLKETGKLLDILNLKCFWVLDLNIKYTLQAESATKNDFLYLDKNIFYVKLDSLKDYERISIELSKVFGSPKGLSDFIENLLLKPSNEKRSESLKVKKIGELPRDEFEWFTKNTSQTVIDDIDPYLSDFSVIDEGTNQVNNLASEKDQSDKHTINEFNNQSITNQKNADDETGQIEIISPSNTNQSKTALTDSPKDNQPVSFQTKSAEEKDWNPEVDPSEVEMSGTKDVIPEFKPSNLSTNRNFQTNSKNPSSEREKNESNKDNLSREAKIKIGRWGEEFAVEKLREKFLGKYSNSKLQETEKGFNILLNNQIKVEVNWLNKYGDYGIGRDIEYIENDEKYYIEVKSTKTDAKEIIQISGSEWELAKNEQENYSIFRIYNAGTNEASPVEIRNPYKEWLDGNLSVQSITIRI